MEAQDLELQAAGLRASYVLNQEKLNFSHHILSQREAENRALATKLKRQMLAQARTLGTLKASSCSGEQMLSGRVWPQGRHAQYSVLWPKPLAGRAEGKLPHLHTRPHKGHDVSGAGSYGQRSTLLRTQSCTLAICMPNLLFMSSVWLGLVPAPTLTEHIQVQTAALVLEDSHILSAQASCQVHNHGDSPPPPSPCTL